MSDTKLDPFVPYADYLARGREIESLKRELEAVKIERDTDLLDIGKYAKPLHDRISQLQAERDELKVQIPQSKEFLDSNSGFPPKPTSLDPTVNSDSDFSRGYRHARLFWISVLDDFYSEARYAYDVISRRLKSLESGQEVERDSLKRELEAMKAALEDRDKMHEEHVRRIEALRMRITVERDELKELVWDAHADMSDETFVAWRERARKALEEK